jgi:general secretion pathway protein F/type IV pilus assembly protein PilC
VSLAARKLSIFYRQLSEQLAAGLTLAQALRMPSPAPAADCERLAALAEAGQSVRTLIADAGPWLPATDRPFLAAAAEAGRLPLILAKLAERYAQLHATQVRVALACAYPFFVFHFAALIFPFLRLIDFEHGLNWSLSGYLGGLGALILPVWGGGALLYVLLRRRNPIALAMLDRLPAIGGYRKNQALADFAFALGNLLEAGAPIGSAWRDAGRNSRSARLEAASSVIQTAIERGQAPGPLLTATTAFPADFVARYQTGERTGGLDAALLALSTDYQGRANQRLVVASMLYPGILFGVVALLVAYFVISFYAGYFGTLNNLANGL